MWIAIKPLRRDKSLAQSKYSMRCKRLLIPSREPGRRIKADLYLPPHPNPGDRDRFRPVLVNYHGSGFVLTGLLGSKVLYCARIACELGIAVLDADYRKAPEHPFPAAIHVIEDVLRWVSSPATENTDYLFDRRRVMLSGFSSGGSLALVAASVLRADTYPSIDADIRAVVGIYPSTDHVTPLEDKKPPKEGIGKSSPEFSRICLDCYMPD
ncbi:Gibberellin receptor GID1B [Diaporthe amygdali]|uniref:Gibberellin receptor GID1B n=1 Tax=Phomopsis amygdali TaxID=1214568 RepID=UPI0022FEBE64|nr:Gibberellin receptor GID1B [Diaporthe amygdali]KAJ0116285.1 Gibberellin receptor GID1B [Diaporthe amygdali]